MKGKYMNKKQAQDQLHQTIYRLADMEGRKAGETVACQPMIVSQHVNMADDNSPVAKQYFVADGVCGFGWVNVRPGTCAFAKWLVKNGKGRVSHYEGGVHVNSPLMTQSLTRNEAYAMAFAKVMNENGIKAYGQSRID